MGAIESDITRYLGYLFSRIFSKWINQHPEFQPYFWLVFGSVFVIALTVAVVLYDQSSEEKTVQPGTANETSTGQQTLSIFPPIRHAYETLLHVFRETIQRLKIETPKNLKIPLFISLGFLLFAIVGDWPYDLFVLLRVIIFTTCVMLLVAIWKANRTTNWLGVLFATAVLYNPLLPIHLHKTTWSWLNALSFIVLGLLCSVLTPN
jgi:hypothetical protein